MKKKTFPRGAGEGGVEQAGLGSMYNEKLIQGFGEVEALEFEVVAGFGGH